MENFEHISFQNDWKLSSSAWYKLGQCKSIIRAISNAPIQPEYRKKLLEISLIKGAQATTAIEGNTLSLDEIREIQEGKNLPPSKEYQEIEIKNILDSYNEILREITMIKKDELISSQLILRFHKMIGKDLGDSFQAIPGQFRRSNVTVGNYRPPNYEEVEELMEKFCVWLKSSFKYSKGKESFSDSIFEAIIAHVYIAWIHPFNDGNGRTARLIEFYILLRAGLPDIASHVLSNFYNETRPEYYRHLDLAYRERDLSKFLEYAIRGLRDGLIKVLQIIQENHFEILWKNYFYEIFKDVKYGSVAVFKRRRELMLKFPKSGLFTSKELIDSNHDLLRTYLRKSGLLLKRDLDELTRLNLLIRDGKKYKANTDILLRSFALRK